MKACKWEQVLPLIGLRGRFTLCPTQPHSSSGWQGHFNCARIEKFPAIKNMKIVEEQRLHRRALTNPCYRVTLLKNDSLKEW